MTVEQSTTTGRDSVLEKLPAARREQLLKIAANHNVGAADPIWSVVDLVGQLEAWRAEEMAAQKQQTDFLRRLAEEKQKELEGTANSTAESLDKALAAAEAAANARLAESGKALEETAVRAIRAELKKFLRGTLAEVRKLAKERVPIQVWAITFIAPIIIGAAVGWLATLPGAEETRLIQNGRLIERAWPSLDPDTRDFILNRGKG